MVRANPTGPFASQQPGATIDRPTMPAPARTGAPNGEAKLETEASPTRSSPAAPAPASVDARKTVEAWEKEITATTDPLRLARLHYEIARTAEVQLGDPRKALAHYQEALSRSPEHLPSLRGARRSMIARKNYQMALPLFDAEARITSKPEIKAALLFAKGRLLEDVLGQKGEARREYAIAAELDRSAPLILKALEQCDTDAGAWSELARTYERLANAITADPEHRAALIARRARILEIREKEPDAAAELYETALRLDPNVSGALDALKRLHHTQRRWRDLIGVLEREVAQSDDPGIRTMALYRIARLHAERLGNRDEALTVLERALKETPNDALVLDELLRLYESAELWADLARVLGSRIETMPESERLDRVALLSRLGQIRHERLNDPDGARQAYEAAVAIAPTYVPGLQALGQLYTNAEDWEALVAMHMAEAEHAEEPRRRAAAHARVAELLEVHLGQPETAIEHHSRALSLQPGYTSSFKALTRLFAASGQWRELVELYTRAVQEAPDAERAISYLMKIGAIYEDSLGEHAQAAHAYRQILAYDSRHLGAIHALQRATERAERWNELVEALELEAELAKDIKQVVALVHRAGEVLDEQLHDRDAAVVQFRRVLGIEPAYAPALASLGRIYHRSGRWEDLLELYKKQLDLTPRGPEAVALLTKMGELAEERVGRDEAAITYYRQAIALDPTCQPALRALARRLRERRNWEELAKVFELELSGLRDPATRARVAYRLGEIYEERLSLHDKAIAAYEQARDADARYRPALDALTRMRAEHGAWRKLVDELEREAGATPDPKLGVAALVRAGEIWSEQLNEPRRASAAYDRVLEREPKHLGAMLAIENLYRRLASFEGLARIYALEARSLKDPKARVAALHELARIQENRLSASADELRQTFEAILSLAPDDPIAIAGLERLAIATNSRELLAAVDQRFAASTSDRMLAAAYRTRLAESLEASDGERAQREYRQALEADPESIAAARGLFRLAERRDDPEALAEAARIESRVVQSPEAAARLLVIAGLMSEERLADPEAALGDYERALELWPDHVEAAQRLLELLLAAGQGDRAADRLARAAQSAKSQERSVELWLEVARLQSDLLENIPGAIGSLSRLLRSAPNHLAVLRRLAELYERDQQWSEAAQLLGRVVQLAPNRDALLYAHLHLSALWDEHLREPARAMVSIKAVLSLEPDNRTALLRLAHLHEREREPEKASEVAGRLVEVSHTPSDRAAALVELARIEAARGKPESAHNALVQAVILEGPSGVAAAKMKEQIRDRGGYARYATALRGHIDRWTNARGQRGRPPRQAWLELAGVLGDSLGEHQESVDTLRDAARAMPDDVDLDRMLAARLLRVGQGQLAVSILRRRILEDVTNIDCWRDLKLAWSAAPDLSTLTLAPLSLLGAATADELDALQARRARIDRARPGSFAPEMLHRIYGIDPAAPVRSVLGAIPEALVKLFPPELDSFGLTTRDKITSRSGHPLRTLADRIAAVMGVEQFDLYVHRARARGVAIELSEPPSIILPAHVAELPEPAQAFALARAFANIATRFHVVDKLTPREIEVLVASAVRANAAGFGTGLTSEDILDEQMRRITRALSRTSKKALLEATPRYVQAPPIDFAALAHTAQVGSVRAALLVADDLLAGVEVLRRTERDLIPIEPHQLITHPLIAEAVKWWISEPAETARRQAGIVG